MPTVPLKPGQLGPALREQAKMFPQAVRRGLIGAARRGQTHMVRKTPTDQGQLRNSWGVRQIPEPTLANIAPHAGIVERGARPHPVSDAGMLELEAWALRNPEVIAAFQDDGKGRLRTREQAARAAAGAIAWKLRHHGQEPTYFVRNELEALTRYIRPEVIRELERMMAKVAGK